MYQITLEELQDDIEMIKLAIKLEDDYQKRDRLEQELMYAQEYLEITLRNKNNTTNT